MSFARALLTAPLVAASFLATSPAQAGCVGTQEIFYACVTTPTVTPTTITQCVYAGGDTCENVEIPFVTVSGGVGFSCHFGKYVPETSWETPC